MMSNEELKRGVTFDEILRMFKYPPYDKEEDDVIKPVDINCNNDNGFVQDFGPDTIPVVKVAPPPLDYLEGLQ